MYLKYVYSVNHHTTYDEPNGVSPLFTLCRVLLCFEPAYHCENEYNMITTIMVNIVAEHLIALGSYMWWRSFRRELMFLLNFLFYIIGFIFSYFYFTWLVSASAFYLFWPIQTWISNFYHDSVSIYRVNQFLNCCTNNWQEKEWLIVVCPFRAWFVL